MSGRFSIYIHFPYCTAKCSYCNFNKYVLPEIFDCDRFTSDIIKDLDNDIKKRVQSQDCTLHTSQLSSIYFGGGTPSLSNPRMISRILEYLHLNPSTRVTDETEVTLEANPTGVESGKLRDFKSAGINRLSLGLQSLDDATLKRFNRDHSATEGLRACEIAKNTFDKVSLDLIYGVAGQKVQDWRRDLRKVMTDFKPSHLSLYQLAIERGTPLFKSKKSERISTDLMADFFHTTREEAALGGYHQYEISSFALGGLDINKSIHNLGYWSSQDYIGVGPGAHGRVYMNGKRYHINRIAAPHRWSSQIDKVGHGIAKEREIKESELREEALVIGLRQTEGIDIVENHLMEIIDQEQLSLFIQKGLLEDSTKKLKATEMGLAVVDGLAIQLLKSSTNQ